MDFHGMKRKQLQALCKKHGVAANLTNREMADRLASIFKENEDPVLSAELRSNTEEICSEDKANSDKKQIKKVRFSPYNQTIEYEVSVNLQPKRSRRQTLSNNPAQALENAVSEDIKMFAGCQSRVTRSRVQNAVEEEIHMVSSSPVGRKRGRGGKKIKDADEVANIGDSEGLELGLKDDAKNGHDKVTGGLSGRQLRSRKNVVREDSKKIRNDKGSGEVHLLDESSDGKNGQEQSMKNARKGDQGVAFSSDVEKVEVVSRVTRQSRAQSKDAAASIVKNEVKIVEAKVENETEKPLRRTKRNSEKDCGKRAVSVISDSQVTKVQEQSESDIALVEPPECLRRHSSRQKSVGSQSGKMGNKEEFPIEETRKRSRTTALEAILEDSSEVERDKYVVTSQQQAPLRRSRRKTLIITAPAAELANEEDIGEVEHLGAQILGQGMTEELDAVVEDGSEVDRAKFAVTSQHQAPLRRSRRKTVIITAPAAELANREDIGEVEHLGAQILGQGMAEELDAVVEDGSEVDRAKFAVTSQHQAPLRRSRRKTVIITAPAAELANKEDIGEVEHLGAQLLGKSMTEELDAIVEDGSEVDRAKYAVTSQHQTPLRRGRRKTVVLTAPSAELADKEDIGRMEQLRAPLLGKGTTEELQQKSSRNSSRYSLSGTSKEDQIAAAESDQGVEQQILEPISEEEETSALEHHPMKQKPQRRSRRITSKSASVAPPNSTPKKGQSKSRVEIVEEEPAPTESLPSPGELPAEKDVQIVVSECAGNKNNLDLDVSKQVVKSGDACSNKSRKELRRNSGAKKQCGFAEASPRFLNMEEDNDSAGNMDETLTASSVKLVRSSKDKEMNQSAHKSLVVYEKESNLVEDDVEKIVNGGKFESEVNCMSSQTVHKTCLLDDASDLKHLKCVTKGSLGADSSLITFPAESHGNEVSDQEMKEDIDLMDVHSSHEYLVVYKEDRALVESEVHVDAADSEMNHSSSTRFLNQRGAVNGSNGVKSRLVEFESNVINMDELTSRDNDHSLADQRNLTGATSTFLHLEKELGTEVPGGENTDFMNDNATAAISRTPFGEAQIIVELKDTNVTAAKSVKEGGFDINKSSEITGLKSELENFLKKAEEMIATDVSHREGIPHIECSVEAAENQESNAQSHSATAETDAQKMLEIQQRQSSYSNTVAPGTLFGGLAPGNQFEDMCRAEAADAAGGGMFDQKRSGDPNPGNEPCIHESVLVYEEYTGLVKIAEEIRVHDDYFESESSPPSNRTDAVDDSNLVESRMVGSESRGRKAVCSEMASVADVFSSATQGSHAGKTSSPMEPKKVLGMQIPSGNMNSINYNMDIEGISSPVVEDQMKGKLENANMTIADSFEEVIFNDLLNELGESIGLKRGSEIPLKTSEKLSATMPSNGERIILIESSVKAEKQEHSTAMDVAAAISGTPNTTEMKCRSSSDTATRGTSVGLAPQSQVQDKLCSSEIIISLMEDEKEKQLQDDTIMSEIKNQPFLSLNKTGSLDDALVEVESNANKVVSSGMTYLADFYSSVNQTKFSGETSKELNLEKVLDLEESSITENVVKYPSDKIEVKEDTSLSPDDQSSMHLEDTDIIATEPIQKVVIRESDKMEVKEVTSPAREDQSSMHLEDANMTAVGPVQELVIWESDKMEVKEDTDLAPEDQSSMHLDDTNMNPAGPVLELVIWESGKMEVNEDTNLAPEDQDKMHLEDTNITAAESVQEVVVWESDKIEVEEDTSLAQEDQSSLQLEDTNITATEPAQEVVYRESDKIEVKEDTILAQGDRGSIHLEDTDITATEPAQELVFWESDKTKVKEDTSFALEDQNSMHLEDINITAAEPVQEVVFRDHMNKVCESESEVSLKKAEETGTNDSSGIVTVQSESSVKTNEMSEATGQKTVMAMQWSLSSHDNDLISPLRTQVGSKDVQGANYRVEIDVSNAGCAVLGQLNNEENVNTVENEDTINSENFVSGKKITDQSSEEKYRADDIYHSLLESIDSQCAKDEKLDISDGSFDNVSDETQEKHACEVLDEGTDPVSLEEKGICNDKLPGNGRLHAINDMQEKPEAVCMDTGNEIQANALPLLAMTQLDDESQTLNQGAEIGEVNARAFSTATQALPAERLTTHITSESFSMNPFDHVLVDGETNASGERGVGHPFINGFAATMDDNGISMSGETDVQEDNVAEKIATSPLKVELTDYTSGNVDAKLYDHNISVTDPIFQDTFGVPSTGYLDEMANAPVAMEAENYGDLDDQGEEVGLEHDHSSSFKVYGLTSTVGLTVDSISVVATLESSLNSSYPQFETKVDDPDIRDSDATKQLDTAFTIDQARVEDGEKSIASHQRSLHGGEEEDVSSAADTHCSKLEISIKKRHPQVMDDINNVVGTEVSTECKVTREERDGCQTNSGCFNDATVGAKSDDCEVSMKTDTDLHGIDNSDVNQSPCLDERKNCNLETEEPNALHFPETEDGDSREVESSSKLNIVSSMKSEMIVDCSSGEQEHLENPDESNIFTNMEMLLLFGVEDEVKNSYAKGGDSNDVALDMAITECNSSEIKEGDYIAISDVEDTNFSVRKDGFENTEETMELRNDFSGLDAAMADKSPLLKGSAIGKGEDGEKTAAFRTELNLLNATAEKKRSNSVPVRQLISSIMKSKSRRGLIQRTPKLPMFHDMKENECSSKREQMGNRTTPKTSSKLRPPLRRI